MITFSLETLITAVSNNISTIFGPGRSIQGDYLNNEKYILSANASLFGSAGVSLNVDLADFVGATDEGRQGFVTTWLDAHTTLGISLLPASISVSRVSFQSEAKTDVTANSLFNPLPSFEGPRLVAGYSIDPTSINPVTLQVTEFDAIDTNVSASLFSVERNVMRAEVDKNLLVSTIDAAVSALPPGASAAQVAASAIQSMVTGAGSGDGFRVPVRTFTEGDESYSFTDILTRRQTLSPFGDNFSATSDNDTISGGFGGDRIYGLSGDDILYGNFSSDHLYGGGDDDVLFGGQGGDRLFGDSGSDIIYGNNSNDTIYGGTGEDTVFGGKGDDTIYGENNNDTLAGNRGDDVIYGGSGTDVGVMNGNISNFSITAVDGGFRVESLQVFQSQGVDHFYDVEVIRFSDQDYDTSGQPPIVAGPTTGTNTSEGTSDLPSNILTSGQVSLGGSVTGNISSSSDSDWFRIDLTSGFRYRFDAEGSPTGAGTLRDPTLRLRDQFGNSVSFNDDGGVGFNSRMDFTPLTSGTYYLDVGGFSSRTGTYTLSASSATTSSLSARTLDPLTATDQGQQNLHQSAKSDWDLI